MVTTEYRGVFFGFIANPEDAASKVVTLTQGQMCIYWSSDVHGVLGLASHGPSSSCRVTRPVEQIVLQGVTSVTGATATAVKLWQDRPWS